MSHLRCRYCPDTFSGPRCLARLISHVEGEHLHPVRWSAHWKHKIPKKEETP